MSFSSVNHPALTKEKDNNTFAFSNIYTAIEVKVGSIIIPVL